MWRLTSRQKVLADPWSQPPVTGYFSKAVFLWLEPRLSTYLQQEFCAVSVWRMALAIWSP